MRESGPLPGLHAPHPADALVQAPSSTVSSCIPLHNIRGRMHKTQAILYGYVNLYDLVTR